MGTYFTGQYGHTSVGGTTVHVTGWNVDPQADEHDCTDTGNSGFGVYITGIKRATFSMELSFDSAQNPLDNPPNLKIGQTISTTKLFVDGAASPYWDFPSAKVISTPMTSNVGDVTKITINCRATGAFTEPAGEFTPQT